MKAVRNGASGLKDRAIAGPHSHEKIPALVERGRKRVADFCADLEERLGEVSFVAGERFSVADIAAVVAVDFATKGSSLPFSNAGAATQWWYGTVSARPSFAA